MFNKNELKILDALISGQITQLITQIQNPNLTTAKSAFAELKGLWPWKRDHTFLVPDIVYGTGESGFVVNLGVDVMKIAEKGLVTRHDYIAKYADEQSLKTIKEYKEKCCELQQKSDRQSLFTEKNKLLHRMFKNGKKSNFADNVCLAIAENTLFDPITTIFNTIIHTKSIEKALTELQNLETQILDQAQQKNITRMDDMHEWVIKHYGYNVLDAARNCYMSRTDYVHIEKNQSILSNNLLAVMHNIQHKNLHMAYTELVNAEKQVTEGLESRNITNPIAQKNRLIKDFGVDVREVMHSAYKERPDYMNLVNLSTPLDVQHATAKILSESTDYESVAQEFDKIAEQVLDNAKLCKLDFMPQVEDHLLQSLHVMRTPRNQAEFVFNATIVDHLLTDIQHQVENIVKGKPTLLERTPELFTRGMVKFITRLNPITQAANIGSLFVGGIHLIENRAVEIALDPITATQNSIATTTSVINFITDIARFTSDTTTGIYYLSTEEGQQRFGTFCKNIVAFGKITDELGTHLTAENIVDATAQVAADFVFGKGFFSALAYLKKIDVVGKMSNEAKVIARRLKQGIDTHFADNSILVTTEGIVLKMSADMKNFGGGRPKNIINRSKASLESAYAKVALELEKEIEIIRQTIKLPDGFAEFAHKRIKIAYKHILGMEIDKYKLDFGGFHHDHKNVIRKSGILEFANQIMNEHGCYQADLIMDGLRIPGKTFFPANWPREKVINKICEAYDNFIKSGAIPRKLPNGTYKIQGITHEGIIIEMRITQNGLINTAYPKI